MRSSLGVALAVVGAVGAIAAGSFTASASAADSFTASKSVASTVTSAAAAAKGPAGTAVPLTPKVVRPTQIGSFKVSLSQYWKVSVSGCLGFPASDKTDRITHTTGLTLEYKAPGGYWNKLAVINWKEPDVRCGTGGIKFTGTFGAKLSGADYRVVYAGTASYAPSTSAAILAWKYDTRITAFTLSPTTVKAGGKVTLKGTLQYLNKTWLNDGGQPLVVGLLRNGTTKWTWPFVVRTNAAGQFSATFKVPFSATWQVRFNGDTIKGGHLSAWTPLVKVTLK